MRTESPSAPIAAADAFVQATGMVIREGGTRAFHRPAEDMIAMPDRDRFRGTATEGWYGVLLHELTHWTGAATRLDRTYRRAPRRCQLLPCQGSSTFLWNLSRRVDIFSVA